MAPKATQLTSGPPGGRASSAGPPVDKPKRRSSTGGEDSLMTSTALLGLAETKTSQANDIEAAAKNAHSSLELKLGRAIAKHKMSVPELIRKWDANGDGEIQKIELRQVVRNHLKIKSDNKEIDALFVKLDSDGGGSIDVKEMAAALKLFEKSVASAAEDHAAEMARGQQLRDDASIIMECATITTDVENCLSRLANIKEGVCDGDLAAKVAFAILSKSKATTETNQRSLILGGWDESKSGVISSDAFVKWVKLYLKAPDGTSQADGMEPEKFTAYYSDLQSATGTAPLNVKEGMAKLWVRVNQMKEEEQQLKDEYEKNRGNVRKQQKAVKDMMMADLAQEQEQQEAAAKDLEERKTAQQEMRASRKAEREAKAAKKAEEAQSFDRKVNARRASSGSVGAGMPTTPQMAEVLAEQIESKKETSSQKEARLRKAFAAFDEDGDGFLTVDELKKVLMRGSSPLTEQDVIDLVKEFDCNGDGALAFDEFSPLWTDVLDDVADLGNPMAC